MQKPLKLTFIADTHHYSKTLGTSGRQYERAKLLTPLLKKSQTATPILF